MNTPEELKSQKQKQSPNQKSMDQTTFQAACSVHSEGRRLTRHEEQVEGSSTARVHIVGTANCTKMKTRHRDQLQ